MYLFENHLCCFINRKPLNIFLKIEDDKYKNITYKIHYGRGSGSFLLKHELTGKLNTKLSAIG